MDNTHDSKNTFATKLHRSVFCHSSTCVSALAFRKGRTSFSLCRNLWDGPTNCLSPSYISALEYY